MLLLLCKLILFYFFPIAKVLFSYIALFPCFWFPIFASIVLTVFVFI